MSFSQRLSKGFGSFKQFAAEKVGTADEVTEMPLEFRNYEKKLDGMKAVYELFYKNFRTLSNAEMATAPISETVMGAVGKLNEKLNLNADNVSKPEPVPKSLYHLAGSSTYDASEMLNDESAFNTNLKKYGNALQKIGDVKVETNAAIHEKFLNPINSTLETGLALAQKARKAAHRSRLELDAVRSKVKAAKPERLSALQQELQDAEAAFVAQVEDATVTMKSFVEMTELNQFMNSLVDSQREFFRQAAGILGDIKF